MNNSSKSGSFYFLSEFMRQPTFHAAVYGIIRDSTGKILTVKRKNTGYLDGWYGLPAGHIEGIETIKEAMQREIQEEV